MCDGISYIFMFLSIATSNMVATSLAKQVSFFLLFKCIMLYVKLSKAVF
jgi:hypothetical protein